MKLLTLLLAAAATLAVAENGLEIKVTHVVDCARKTEEMDTVYMHYRGRLADGDKEFDASYNRGQPFRFTLGTNQVIKGWDKGLLGMCIGEKRTLTIPPELGYGNRAVGGGLIPAGSTLVFETELIGIHGYDHEAEEKKAADKPADAESPAPEPAEPEPVESPKVVEKVASVIGAAADAAMTVLVDSDDGQEHNEL